MVKIQTEDLMGGEVVEGAYDLMDGNDEVSQGQLHLSVQYVSKQALEEIEAGKEVPRAYFPARENNRLILYQDAETQPMPQVRSYSSLNFCARLFCSKGKICSYFLLRTEHEQACVSAKTITDQ